MSYLLVLAALAAAGAAGYAMFNVWPSDAPPPRPPPRKFSSSVPEPSKRDIRQRRSAGFGRR